ncbi:MAG: hypothetical protein IJI47_03625 [Eubacterium sp.]|nr:hypothetical protein [Eubacterium sp.]
MHEHHHHTVNADSAAELKALVEYMVNHNVSHTEELSQIAAQLKETGNDVASEKTLAAIEEYNKGNALLKDALDKLK